MHTCIFTLRVCVWAPVFVSHISRDFPGILINLILKTSGIRGMSLPSSSVLTRKIMPPFYSVRFALCTVLREES